jgi:hypothetical protein
MEKIERDIEEHETCGEAEGNLDALQQRQVGAARHDAEYSGCCVLLALAGALAIVCFCTLPCNCLAFPLPPPPRAADPPVLTAPRLLPPAATRCLLPPAATLCRPQIFDSRAAFRRLANELEELFKAQDFNMVGAGGWVQEGGWVGVGLGVGWWASCSADGKG